MRTRLLALATVGVLGGTMAACGDSSDSPSGTAAAGGPDDTGHADAGERDRPPAGHPLGHHLLVATTARPSKSARPAR